MGRLDRSHSRAVGQDREVEWLTEAGLGLDNDTLRLERSTQVWVDVGGRMRDHLADLLAHQVAGVEQVGSSSVVGLLAKPIIDIAIGIAAEYDLQAVHESLVGAGWIYRGDAGESGGHVFVLESKPGRRVAHAHLVDHQGEQWLNYLRLRDLLRADPSACARYEAVKQQLVSQVGDDRVAYTDGKTSIVHQLLQESAAARDK